MIASALFVLPSLLILIALKTMHTTEQQRSNVQAARQEYLKEGFVPANKRKEYQKTHP